MLNSVDFCHANLYNARNFCYVLVGDRTVHVPCLLLCLAYLQVMNLMSDTYVLACHLSANSVAYHVLLHFAAVFFSKYIYSSGPVWCE